MCTLGKSKRKSSDGQIENRLGHTTDYKSGSHRFVPGLGSVNALILANFTIVGNWEADF